MFLVHYECTYPSVFYFLSEGGKYFKFTFCFCLDHVSLTTETGSQEPWFKFQLKLLLRYGTWFSPVHTFFQVILENLHLFWLLGLCGKWTELAYPFFQRPFDELLFFWSFCHLLIPPFSIPWPPQHTSSAFSYNVYVRLTFSLFPTIVVRIRVLQRNRTIGQ